MIMIRVGTGFDVHRLKEGRKLIMGGVDIPYETGLDGHSDADVLVHAIMDALLGSMALGDLGKHFPDTDPAFQGADSMGLLKLVKLLIEARGGEVINVDSTILAEKPKMAGHVDKMRENIAAALDVDCDRISVKATTLEKMGFLGRGEGIGAMSTVAVEVSP
jgi:2-C-methyl-D-erythritol 2,4-cyclodiphosphate synthase